MNLEDYLMYLEDLCIIHLMYLGVRDSFDVPERFVNLYIMVIMKDLLTFLDNDYYDCFMITIMKNLLVFLDNGRLLYDNHYERPFSFPRYMYQKPIKGHHLRLVKIFEEIQVSRPYFFLQYLRPFVFILQHKLYICIYIVRCMKKINELIL